MIRYTLKCQDGHGFDSWFRDADGFSAQQAAGQIVCPVCGSTAIDKELMAPAVRPGRAAEGKPATPSLGTPASELEAAIAALKKKIEESSEYVGMNFAAEARAMHAGDAPERAIHGEARPEEARQMIEDGLPVAPLPFIPARKVN